MKRIVITGYVDRRDGPSAFIKCLSDGLSCNYEICHIGSSLNFSDVAELVHSEVFLFNSNNLVPILIFPLKLIFRRRRFISVFHGRMGLNMKPSLKKILLQISEWGMLHLSDAIVFVSNMQRDDFFEDNLSKFKCKSHVIYNGLDLKLLELSRGLNKEKIIVYAGGENEKKGRSLLDFIIDRISVRPELSGYTLILLGMSTECSYRVGNLLVDSRRKISHQDALDYYARSEIFVSLSEYETFGIACLEAYYLENKVVCYKSCGFLEITGSENIYVSQQYSAECLAEKVFESVISPFVKTTIDNDKVSTGSMIHRYEKLIESKGAEL